MNEYHKIQTVFKRDPENRHKTLLEGDYSLPELEYLCDNQWLFTEKVDGTNIRIMFSDKGITFGGKTDNAQLHPDLLATLNSIFIPLQEYFEKEFVPPEGQPIAVCLYGEGYGAGIQKGGCYRQDKAFILFDIKIGEWWLQRAGVEDVARKLNLDTVPSIGTGTLGEMVEKARKGFLSQWGEFKAEGIVARPATELKTRSGHRVITKIKCKDFV